ncbi:MAG: type IV secretory system conjugative DNA transfer family protein [Sphingomonadaceae bacterium]|nr:type IV secretory system conjugative DNA transfer family protein [Sphingomonadaceae bacterium]
MIDYESDRFGSASWADEFDITRAGLFERDGQFLGYFGNRPMHLRSDAPGLIVAGSGAGKFRDLLAETILRSPDENYWIFDPKGEICSVTLNAFVRAGGYLNISNPYGLHGLTHDRVNPFESLTAGNPRLHADTETLMASLVTETGDTSYFVNKAREWCTGLTLGDVERNGRTSPTKLYHIARAIVSDASAWDAQLTSMDQSSDPVIRGVAGEIWDKQKNAPREFQAIYGTIVLALSFLNDPRMRDAMEASDFSLEDLCKPGERPHSFAVILPAEYIKPYAGFVRLLFAATVLAKYRHPGGKPLRMVLDEAGQLGKLEIALDIVTYGRGAGIVPEFVFQDIGQITRNYGSIAIQTFFGSCQRRRLFGVRDYETARLVSNMLGEQTLDYDDLGEQSTAAQGALNSIRRLSMGGDAEQAAYEFAFYEEAARRPTKMRRDIMSADEALNMPEDRMVAFISGLDLPPIHGHKYPYYTHRDLAGLWLPNPHHPPLDRVTMPNMWGSTKTVPVITTDVPRELAHFPQYANGTLRYVEGHYPF